MPKQRILVIEDDGPIRKGILHTLRFNGYDTAEAADWGTGMEALGGAPFDLLLLDLNLPGGDGLEILKRLRETSVGTPVIVLTARGEETDRVRGLKLGADDYVVKPFGVMELLARIEAVLRRSPARPQDDLHIPLPDGLLDLGRREVVFTDGTRTPLSERESELLAFLARNPGRAIPRDEILARVWHLNPDAVETRTVDMHVARLREKLRDDGSNPQIIRTLRGRGYQFGEGAL